MSLLELVQVKKHFPIQGGLLKRVVTSLKAVDGVSFSLAEGEVLGLVGESGCGKSSLARTIVQLYQATEGQILFEGKDLGAASRSELIQLRRELQMIFQDPFESLNPRHTIGQILEEPFIIHQNISAKERSERAKDLLEQVGLPASSVGRYPHEFSEGKGKGLVLQERFPRNQSSSFVMSRYLLWMFLFNLKSSICCWSFRNAWAFPMSS